MKLYELSSEYRRLASLADDAAAPEELDTALAEITGEIKVKGGNIAAIISELDAAAGSIREGEKRQAARRKALESAAERLRAYLLNGMLSSDIHSISTPLFKITVRDNPPSVAIDDEAAIPADYMRQPPPEPDKRKMLDDMKEGVVIDGAHIERGKRLHIS